MRVMRPPDDHVAYDERRQLLPKGQSQVDKRPQGAYLSHETKLVALVIAGTLLAGLVCLGPFIRPLSERGSVSQVLLASPNPSDHTLCRDGLCFRPGKIQVLPTGNFPSFWTYGGSGPMNVTYDSRSIVINGERALFLSGSMHPVRATKATWEAALDEAVRHGLNMVTIYVIWQIHQPFPDRDIDWSLPGQPECESPERDCEWNLAGSIRSAANRGLFVHIRVGPYVCAEYDYGGIPRWVALGDPEIAMRRPNKAWMERMRVFVTETVAYLTINNLWAYQGGPIVMAQIENELGGDVDASTEHLVKVNSEHRIVDGKLQNKGASELGNATLQDYADWCGSLAASLAPEVIWTMCNGLSAKNTISTFNGDSGVSWLENHGNSGRIQIDQPAIWTEDEGGFQIWGDEANRPSDYFWGRTARSMAYQALRWFARGGTHLNYYMFWGGYNRGRMAAAGIMNAYASDAIMCPSGQRRQPKYGHFQALHEAITEIASLLLTAETALFKNETVNIWSEDKRWTKGTEQLVFRYQTPTDEAIFVENNSNVLSVVKVITRHSEDSSVFAMEPYSAILLVNNILQFDSAGIQPREQSFQRMIKYGDVVLLDRTTWREPVGASKSDPHTRETTNPPEQTALLFNSSILSDYAWYETDFFVDTDLVRATLFVDTQEANAIVAFVDGIRTGSVDTHRHTEGNVTLSMTLGRLSKGSHKLSLLSESLGYSNLIGRWGASTIAKLKGLTGDVVLSYPQLDRNMSLVDGRTWRSLAALHGERLAREDGLRKEYLAGHLDAGWSPCSWTSLSFDTPRYDPVIQALFLDVRTGRGHLWLNGRDLGRYWNITRGETDELSQAFYFIPNDYLYTRGQLNELVLFDAFGGDHGESNLALSWIEPSDEPNFMDEVDYHLACI